VGERSRAIRGPLCARRFESLGKPNPAKGEGRTSIVSRGAEPEAPVSAPRRPPTSFPLFCCSVPGKSGEVATRCPQRSPAFTHSGQRSRAAGPRRFLGTRACLWANGRQSFFRTPPRLAIRRVLFLFLVGSSLHVPSRAEPTDRLSAACNTARAPPRWTRLPINLPPEVVFGTVLRHCRIIPRD
jgi:hypothetical protein